MSLDELIEILNGRTIVYQDPLDLDKLTECMPVLVEHEDGFTFVYLMAIDKTLNTHWEPKLNDYIFSLIELSMLEQKRGCYIKYDE